MTNRTIADVITEWRKSPMNNDDGELASRINYYIGTEVILGQLNNATEQVEKWLIRKSRTKPETNWPPQWKPGYLAYEDRRQKYFERICEYYEQ